MDIHEYQAKEILAGFGVPVPVWLAGHGCCAGLGVGTRAVVSADSVPVTEVPTIEPTILFRTRS